MKHVYIGQLFKVLNSGSVKVHSTSLDHAGTAAARWSVFTSVATVNRQAVRLAICQTLKCQ